MKKMSIFYDWLKNQEGKDTLAGAMADDLSEYKDDYIVKDLDREGWIKYLIDEKSCKTVIKAFKLIWNDFEKEQIEDEAIKKMEEEILNLEIPLDPRKKISKKHEEEIVPEKLEEEPLEINIPYDENAVKDMFDIVKEDEENPTAEPFAPKKMEEETSVEPVQDPAQEEQKKSKSTNKPGDYTKIIGSMLGKMLFNKIRG